MQRPAPSRATPAACARRIRPGVDDELPQHRHGDLKDLPALLGGGERGLAEDAGLADAVERQCAGRSAATQQVAAEHRRGLRDAVVYCSRHVYELRSQREDDARLELAGVT